MNSCTTQARPLALGPRLARPERASHGRGPPPPAPAAPTSRSGSLARHFRTALGRASGRLPPLAWLAGWPGAAGPAARAASAANAATSTIPAAIPAVLRISLNPNRPIHTDWRYPPRVASASVAPAAASSRLPVASTAAATLNTALT